MSYNNIKLYSECTIEHLQTFKDSYVSIALWLYEGEIRDLPTVLYVPVCNPCMDSEKLCVAVNIMTGNFLSSLDSKCEWLYGFIVIYFPVRDHRT